MIRVGWGLLAVIVVTAGCGSDGDSSSETSAPGAIDRLVSRLEAESKRDRQLPGTASTALLVSDNQRGAVDVEATAAYLEATIKHADKVWTRWFLANGLQEPFVQFEIVRPGQTFQSKCDGGRMIPSDYPNAIYCPVDGDAEDPGMIILPVQTMARMWTGDIFSRQVDRLKRTGDFAAGVITAHEFGHHVADSLATQVARAQPQKPNSELIADCFAGVWADSVRLENYLEEGDIDEGLEALAVIGDDTGDHGTGQERDDAFNIGLNGTQSQPGGGEPLRCIEVYWN